MTRFSKTFPCLNGPKEGTWVDAPADTQVGRSVALPWIDAAGKTQYAVYIVTQVPNPDGSVSIDPTTAPSLGLMFIKSHKRPEQAQEHVDRLAFAIGMAKEAAASN